MQLPPARIGDADVIQYVVLDYRHRATGTCQHVVGGRPATGFAGLAIVRNDAGAGYMLFYCDATWNVVADTWHESLENAVSQAEAEFAGTGDTWIAVDRSGD